MVDGRTNASYDSSSAASFGYQAPDDPRSSSLLVAAQVRQIERRYRRRLLYSLRHPLRSCVSGRGARCGVGRASVGVLEVAVALLRHGLRRSPVHERISSRRLSSASGVSLRRLGSLLLLLPLGSLLLTELLRAVVTRLASVRSCGAAEGVVQSDPLRDPVGLTTVAQQICVLPLPLLLHLPVLLVAIQRLARQLSVLARR